MPTSSKGENAPTSDNGMPWMGKKKRSQEVLGTPVIEPSQLSTESKNQAPWVGTPVDELNAKSRQTKEVQSQASQAKDRDEGGGNSSGEDDWEEQEEQEALSKETLFPEAS